METKEKNELIRDFMQAWEKGDDDLLYNTSWDWIMPVYIKIMDTLQNLDRPSKNHTCEGDMIEVNIFCHLRVADIEKMWEQIIVFIEWYNKTYPDS